MSQDNMPSRLELIEYAKTLIDTPYIHQGRLPHVGLDCLGVVLAIANHFNLSFYENISYSRYGDGVELIQEFENNLYRTTEPLLGDVLIFKFRNVPSHVGILSELNGHPSLIHAYSTQGKTAEHNLDSDDWWSSKICDSFSFYNS